jgi:hypothetical protein
MPFRNPSLRPTEIQAPTRLQQSPGERAFLRKLRIGTLKRALWRNRPLRREHRLALVAGGGTLSPAPSAPLRRRCRVRLSRQ